MKAQGLMIGRLALAALLGYGIGWEREYRHSPAGERTFALVALGSAAFMSLAALQLHAGRDAVFIGVSTGVGFLGGGLILRARGAGLTSAASLWGTAAMGILIGSGAYVAGIVGAALIVGILELDYMPGAGRLDPVRRRGEMLADLRDEPPPPRSNEDTQELE